MIVTELYEGQGFGNQLWAYATTRVLAKKLGYDFGIQSPWRFKGKNFLKLDMGRRVIGLPNRFPSATNLPIGISRYFRERKLVNLEEGFEITPFDLELLQIQDGTKFDGYFQSELLIKPLQEEISDWFKVENKLNKFDCLINIRGGEYKHYDTLSLSEKYYRNAMQHMKELHGIENFAIITDDLQHANKLLPEIPILSKPLESYPNLGRKILDDFGKLQYAKNLILSNSSFSWWGAWTNVELRNSGKVIAPKYWARHNSNDGFWSLADSLTEDWNWVDAKGRYYNYKECLIEKQNFEESEAYRSRINFPNN